jgi:hypothetical protein
MAAFASDTRTGTMRNPGSVESVQARQQSQHAQQNGEARSGSDRIGRATEAPMVFSAASKSVEFSDRLRAHHRETRRIACEIPCSVEVVLMDGTVYDSGVAMLLNISPSGALMSAFELGGGSFPAELFKMRMVLKGDPYAGIGIEATPVRFASGTHGVGVKFDEIFVTA